jgi:protein-S-isoprenylcysteine O-methyltransferase Ste14
MVPWSESDGKLTGNWLIILIYFVFVGFGWLVFRVFVRRDYQQRGELSRFSAWLEVLVFFVHGVLSYLYMDAVFPKMPPLEPRPVLNAMAFIFMGLGLLGVIAAMTKLGYGTTLGQDSGGLRQIGLYAFSRNPQIIFYSLLILGYGLLWPSWLVLVWVGVFLIVAHLMVITEEEYLMIKFGDDYLNYCSQVPRYILKLS